MKAEDTGKKIAELRKAKNMTQKELAALVHVTDKAVSKWERGVNFPDLGLMEDLSKHLDTTPAVLLGLEAANRDEIVASVTELSVQQAEDAASDIQKVSWLNLAVGILLFVLVMFGFGGGEMLFYMIADFIVIGSVYMLHKYGAIYKWELMDIVLAEILIADIVICLAIQFFTGSGIYWLASALFFGIAAVCLQLLFYRVMKPHWAKVIPVVAGAGMACWGILLWLAAPAWQNLNLLESITYYGLPLICCLSVWILCRMKDSERQKLL
ncbi:MAG: helix-turn-helix transcriptional regulator, partial [Firmicutes bacterium]|nr:helix-turn-helix transcriptional regulator [Bacillota bacterium]